MYLEYWGLQKFPFENAPDPEFMYYSSEHEEALIRLIYAVKRNKGAVLLSGEIGCGKTMLSRVFIQQLPEAEFDIGLMTNPSLEPIDFLKEAIYQIGLTSPSNTKPDLLKVLNDRMLENTKNNRSMLLVVDEAQLIPKDTFEEIRLLLNFQLNDRYLLNLVLLGQPELREIIREYKQLDQRIAIRYHLNPLNLDDTGKYVVFRLEKAGRSENMFTAAAMEEIYGYSQGVPRKINNICDLALLIGFSAKTDKIDRDIIKKVLKDSL
ncbi:MAG: AAA family ATPase [Deltaproteobacteria bacterium]|nr:AAA family ATPase [Deltaproteobacteria bacterium]